MVLCCTWWWRAVSCRRRWWWHSCGVGGVVLTMRCVWCPVVAVVVVARLWMPRRRVERSGGPMHVVVVLRCACCMRFGSWWRVGCGGSCMQVLVVLVCVGCAGGGMHVLMVSRWARWWLQE